MGLEGFLKSFFNRPGSVAHAAEQLSNDPNMQAIRAQEKAKLEAAELQKAQHELLIKNTEQRVMKLLEMAQQQLQAEKKRKIEVTLLEEGKRVRFSFHQDISDPNQIRFSKWTEGQGELDLILTHKNGIPTVEQYDYGERKWRKTDSPDTATNHIFSGEYLLELVAEIDQVEESLSTYKDMNASSLSEISQEE